ncbi:HD domain-containing protein [Candidatus Micrarchaeota archaeon]|nr:HD domain-containing protein [Candidatus Micrarchaeota archaeon]
MGTLIRPYKTIEWINRGNLEGLLHNYGLDPKSHPIRRAFELAREAHGSQPRKENRFRNSLTWHAYPVAAMTARLAHAMKEKHPELASPEVLCAALLHDYAEDLSQRRNADSELVMSELEKKLGEGGGPIIHWVGLLTKKGLRKYGGTTEVERKANREAEYAKALEESGEIVPVVIKAADRLNNISRLSRLARTPRQRVKNWAYLQETKALYLPIFRKYGLNPLFISEFERILGRQEKNWQSQARRKGRAVPRPMAYRIKR